MLVYAQSHGNTDSEITVLFPNGTTEQAIAGNDINSGNLLLLFDETSNRYYAYSETSPYTVLDHQEGIQEFPEEVEEVPETLLPFQILFLSDPQLNTQLGGDRSQVSVYDSNAIATGGINNLGDQTYLAVWLEGTQQFVVDNNGAQTFLAYTPLFDSSFFSWLGNGFLNTVIYPEIPEENLTKEILTFDQDMNPIDIPSEVSIPLYPFFVERPNETLLTAIVHNTQNEGQYNFLQTENLTYENNRTGSNEFAVPLTATIACNSITVGTSTTEDYLRGTRTDYLKTVNQTLDSFVDNWFNNSVNNGPRIESYIETYDYQASPAFFASVTSFFCDQLAGGGFGLFDWVQFTDTYATWTGETTDIIQTYTRTVNEPEWQKNMSVNFTRTQYHLYTEQYDSDTTYTIPNMEWLIPQGAIGFQFYVTGSDIRNETKTTNESRITPTSLLISGDGGSVLFSENTQTLESDFSSFRDRDIDKSVAYNYSGDITRNLYTTTDIVDRTNEDKLYLALGTQLIDINLDDAWFFSAISPTAIAALANGVEALTIVNDDESPIYKARVNYATHYRREETIYAGNVTLDQVEYFDVEDFDYPYWETIETRSVYLITGAFRYSAEVIFIDTEDNPVDGFPIESDRSILGIELIITAVESYPIGLADLNEIIIVPQDNVALLLRDRLLNSENKNYCNLVGNALYFAKSVASDLTATEQFSEVYLIDLTVTQEAPESGPFIPVNNSSQILGISYFPAA